MKLMKLRILTAQITVELSMKNATAVVLAMPHVPMLAAVGLACPVVLIFADWITQHAQLAQMRCHFGLTCKLIAMHGRPAGKLRTVLIQLYGKWAQVRIETLLR